MRPHLYAARTGGPARAVLAVLAALAAAGVSLVCGPVAAQYLGPEFPVNTHTALDQAFPAVAVNASGAFVVAWQSDGQDGSRLGVYAQRFDHLGSKLGPELQLNTYTASDQSTPAVALRDDGSFVAAWHSTDQDGHGRGVYARHYRPDGAPVTDEFRVNSYTYGDQERPAVASDPNGNLVVVWHRRAQDGSGLGVFGRRISARTVPTAFASVDAAEIGGAVRVRWDLGAGVAARGL